jgi:YVTN family beta-propeller protein
LQADSGGLSPAATIELGGEPSHVVPAVSGKRAYVTDSRNDSVVVVDLQAKMVAARIPVGSYPHGLRLSPDGRLLAVANMNSDTVSLVDLDAGRSDTIAVGRRPVQVAFSPDGRRLFVTLNAEDNVAAVDLQTRRVLYRAAVGRGPVQLAVTPDGKRIVVANQGPESAPDDRVTVLNAVDGSLVQQIDTGRGAHGVAIDSSGDMAYVTNTYEDSVSAVDLIVLREVKRYRTGKEPNGIAVR